MADVIREYGYGVFESDIVTGTDFLTSDHRAESIVTNPPYRLLNEFVLKGLEQTDGILALLVGCHLLSGGSKRVREVWDPYPPSRILVIPERMVVNGSASLDYSWVAAREPLGVWSGCSNKLSQKG